MKKLVKSVVIALALGCALGGVSTRPAHALGGGFSRPVNIPVLNFFLSHTYQWLDGYGYTSFGGSSSGGNWNGWDWNANSGTDGSCMNETNNLTYAITGVCHQGTNRALQHTSVPYVVNMSNPSVDGSGLSNGLYCTFGRGLWCYGSPC